MMSSRIEKNLLTAMSVTLRCMLVVFGLILLPAPELYADAPVCSTIGYVTTCRIDRPGVDRRITDYPTVKFLAGDTVNITAGGCVQTGGTGQTWKHYVYPSGSALEFHGLQGMYHGLIQLPGWSMFQIKNALNQTFPISTEGTLTLGYEDSNYSDNGYWGHDDGTHDQCKNEGPAWVFIKITKGFKVTPSTGTGGHITPNAPQTVSGGSSTAFELTPDTGYTISVGGACGGSLSGNKYTTKAITRDCTVSAAFHKPTTIPTEYKIITLLSPAVGGSISPAKAEASSGETKSFTVTANPGYLFDSIGGCGKGTLKLNTTDKTTATYVTGPITADCTVTASFYRLNTLNVTKTGTGSGAVTTPNFIDCGSKCSNQIRSGNSLTLTATPAPGSTFTGWSGGCSGTGACTITVKDNTQITAAFTANARTIAGKWTLTRGTATFQWTILSNGTFSDNFGGAGSWTSNGDQVMLLYPDAKGTVYKGAVNPGKTYMSGTVTLLTDPKARQEWHASQN